MSERIKTHEILILSLVDDNLPHLLQSYLEPYGFVVRLAQDEGQLARLIQELQSREQPYRCILEECYVGDIERIMQSLFLPPLDVIALVETFERTFALEDQNILARMSTYDTGRAVLELLPNKTR